MALLPVDHFHPDRWFIQPVTILFPGWHAHACEVL
jgi:hypothetical protein